METKFGVGTSHQVRVVITRNRWPVLYLREVDGDNDGLSDVISVTETLYHRIGLRTDIKLSTNYMFKPI